MKHLIADLIEKIADHEASRAEAFIQLDVIKIIVMALLARLDEPSKEDIRLYISQAFDEIETQNETEQADYEHLRRATFSLLDSDIS
ncbi:sigma-S stabilization anti-adapter protein IraP [Atlantibacter hermannii]|uniref:sigma-S stabilization anti-adapter protein IraP n=1 Tax=Atlantibacter hermannii TaxID=565 RepID=UPI0028ABF77D|nr:sigma-S stabilization anti-adapter protein IraP [Atlantibacter hermannii]